MGPSGIPAAPEVSRLPPAGQPSPTPARGRKWSGEVGGAGPACQNSRQARLGRNRSGGNMEEHRVGWRRRRGRRMSRHGLLSSGFFYFPKNSGSVIFIVSRSFFFPYTVTRLGAHRKEKKKTGALQHCRTATCIIHSRHGGLVSRRAFATTRRFAHAAGQMGGRRRRRGRGMNS